MKIAVINGSPKGQYSITLQTVRYLERKYPEHEFRILNAGQLLSIRGFGRIRLTEVGSPTRKDRLPVTLEIFHKK